MPYQLYMPNAQRRFPYTGKPIVLPNFPWQQLPSQLFLALLYDIEMHGTNKEYDPTHMLANQKHPLYTLMVHYLNEAQMTLSKAPTKGLLDHIHQATPVGKLMLTHAKMYVRRNPFTGQACLDLADPWNKLTEYELLAVFLGQEFNRLHMTLDDIPRKDRESYQWYTTDMPSELVAHRGNRTSLWTNFYDDVNFCFSGGYPDELTNAYSRMYVMLP